MAKNFVCAAMLCAGTCAALLAASGCREKARDIQAVGAPRLLEAEIVDSPENRLREARKCVEAYPAPEFGADLTEQAADIVGRSVAEDVRTKMRQRLSAEDFQKLRIELLVRTFTAKELALLAEVYRMGEGPSLLRKLNLYNEDWRKLFAPVLLEELSNVPQDQQ
ncbi:MAG TPA: hypothetical protein PLP17_09840 [Oligoflexia bacterium]|nr:hypothetical protein [Oligoflexia bacterium]